MLPREARLLLAAGARTGRDISSWSRALFWPAFYAALPPVFQIICYIAASVPMLLLPCRKAVNEKVGFVPNMVDRKVVLAAALQWLCMSCEVFYFADVVSYVDILLGATNIFKKIYADLQSCKQSRCRIPRSKSVWSRYPRSWTLLSSLFPRIATGIQEPYGALCLGLRGQWNYSLSHLFSG